MIMNVGVIGQGFVGSAVAVGFRSCGLYVATYDKYVDKLSTMSLSRLVDHSDVIFVCVPTPADLDNEGACDTSIVEGVIDDIIAFVQRDHLPRTKTVVVKSTVIPGTTDKLQARAAGWCDVVFNPEFLNARSALEDFITQDHVIIGGANAAACDKVAELYRKLVPDARIEVTSAIIAETVKYTKNCFFATKVSFFNEIYQICECLGISYDEMIALARLDERVGFEHTRVPGPSAGAGPCAGRMMKGYGGTCLVKDVQALRVLARQLGIDPKVLDAAWEKNLEVRPERDWEYLSSYGTRVRKM